MPIERIDHIQLAMPAGQEDLARTFYTGLLGIPEVPKPKHLALRGGVWFETSRVKIHLGVDPNFRPARKAHPGLIVGDLQTLLKKLKTAGVEVLEAEPLPGFDHIYVVDVFGNRLELLQPLEPPIPYDLGTILLEGKEVTLRPLELGDAAALAAATSESRHHYGYSWVPDGIDETKAYIVDALNQRAAGDRYPFTVVWLGRVVGTTSYAELRPWSWAPDSGLQRYGLPDVLEIGYTWLAASSQRTRCNTEAKFLLLQHAFETWKVHRAFLRTDERNERSRRAIERIGAKLEGIRRADMPGRDNTVRNSAYFSIVIADWPEAKTRLTRLLE